MKLSQCPDPKHSTNGGDRCVQEKVRRNQGAVATQCGVPGVIPIGRSKTQPRSHGCDPCFSGRSLITDWGSLKGDDSFTRQSLPR